MSYTRDPCKVAIVVGVFGITVHVAVVRALFVLPRGACTSGIAITGFFAIGMAATGGGRFIRVYQTLRFASSSPGCGVEPLALAPRAFATAVARCDGGTAVQRTDAGGV